jgi:hypothetical protein
MSPEVTAQFHALWLKNERNSEALGVCIGAPTCQTSILHQNCHGQAWQLTTLVHVALQFDFTTDLRRYGSAGPNRIAYFLATLAQSNSMRVRSLLRRVSYPTISEHVLQHCAAFFNAFHFAFMCTRRFALPLQFPMRM